VRLSAIGSAGAVIVSLVMVLPMAFFFKNIYGMVNDYVGWILVLIVIVMIATENGEYEEGQGSLRHLKYKFYALLLFFISGFLGIFAFDNTALMQPPHQIRRAFNSIASSFRIIRGFHACN
jgi:putative membrane protein